MTGGRAPLRVVRAQLLDEGADVGERFAWRHAHAHVRRGVADADAESEAAAGDLVHEGRALREIAYGARIDRCDRGGERDAIGDVAQRLAQRHVGEHAGRVDGGEAAPLDFACRLERGTAPSRNGNQADGRKLLGHRVLLLCRFVIPADRSESGNPTSSAALCF